MKSPEEKTLRITSISPRGCGVAEQTAEQTTPIEVPFTLPGEIVTASVFSKKRRRGFKQARLESIVQPSAQRVSARCLHFGLCGGCQWQHLPYAEQLRIKEQWIERWFSGILPFPPPLQPILPSPIAWEYRNKMECTFSGDRHGNQFIGLFAQGGRSDVFSLHECHLAASWFSEVVCAVRSWWKVSGLEAFHPRKRTGSLRYLTLRRGFHTGDRMIVLTVSGEPAYAWTATQKKECIARLAPLCDSLFLRIEQSQKGRETQYYELLLSGKDHLCEELHIRESNGTLRVDRYSIAPTAFFQPNTRQAEAIYSTALQMVSLSSKATVYDLFCGAGGFAITFANRARRIIGIDLSHESIVDARENAKRNGYSQIEFVQGDVAKILSGEPERWPPPDLVIVDPPRAGLDPKMRSLLLALSPSQILYVSCNPATQARDVRDFYEGGYRIVSRQAIDQFPHTIHLENVILLQQTSQ